MNISNLVEHFYKMSQQLAAIPPTSIKNNDFLSGQKQTKDRFGGATGAELDALLQQEATKKGFNIVPNKITPLNETAVKNAIRGWISEKYSDIKDEEKEMIVLLLFAQIKLETGMKSSHNFNVGNIHATIGGKNAYWAGTVSVWDDPQIVNGKEVINKNWFWRAYPTLENGVGDYCYFISKRFPDAIDAAKTGNIKLFVEILKKRGYFTASIEKYYKSISRIVQSQLDARNKSSTP